MKVLMLIKQVHQKSVLLVTISIFWISFRFQPAAGNELHHV